MMTEYQVDVFKGLMRLVNTNDTFFKKEIEFMDARYFVFNYRLASYSDFLEPHALEARGITFLVDENDNPLKLVCWPMEKFFNINENPFTENLDHTYSFYAMVKEDGSLISSMLDKFGVLTLKSKSEILSKQAIAASEWLALPENEEFYKTVLEVTSKGYTVNMEWTSPDERIILEYEKPALKVLNVRCNKTGEYMHRLGMFKEGLGDYAVKVYYNFGHVKSLEELKKKEDVEGWVIMPINRYHRDKVVNFCKIKTDWYLNLHKLKFSVESAKALYFCCLNEQADDVKSMLFSDKELIKRVELMEKVVRNNYNYIAQRTDSFYEENKHLTQKEYAIKAKEQMPNFHGILMTLYNGTAIYTVKTYMEKNYKDMVEIFNQLGGYDA